MVTGQRAEVDVDRPAEAVPACETFRLHTLDIPQRIRDVLEIEADAAFRQTWSFPTPFTEEVTVRSLTRLVAVWSAQSLVHLSLRARRKSEQAKDGPQQTCHSEHLCAHISVNRKLYALRVARG